MKLSHTGFNEADYDTLCHKRYDELTDRELLEILMFNTEAQTAKFAALELHGRLRQKEYEQAVQYKALEALKVLKEFLK